MDKKISYLWISPICSIEPPSCVHFCEVTYVDGTMDKKYFHHHEIAGMIRRCKGMVQGAMVSHFM